MKSKLPIRCEFSKLTIVVALIFVPVFVSAPTAFVLWFFLKNPKWDDAHILVSAVLMSCLFAYLTMRDFQWVEFDGTHIRARRFWTRQFVEKTVADIDEIRDCGEPIPSAGSLVLAKLMGPIRRYEIRFCHGPKIHLMTTDMANVVEFVDAVSMAFSQYQDCRFEEDDDAESGSWQSRVDD